MPPCRCLHCDYAADGDDGKCHTCRTYPELYVPCRFLDDDEYAIFLQHVAAHTREAGG